jgi:hypothetical protein
MSEGPASARPTTVIFSRDFHLLLHIEVAEVIASGCCGGVYAATGE